MRTRVSSSIPETPMSVASAETALIHDRPPQTTKSGPNSLGVGPQSEVANKEGSDVAVGVVVFRGGVVGRLGEEVFVALELFALGHAVALAMGGARGLYLYDRSLACRSHHCSD
jgi:hypothetical protein